MKIGIIGTGNMGRVVGLSLSQAGHNVFFGARDISQAKFASTFDDTTQIGNNQEAAEFGEVVYYSPRDINPNEVLTDTGALNGKVVIESHNWPLNEELRIDTIKKSKSEILQEQIPSAKVVKAFNTITQEVFNYSANQLKELDISCFIASDYSEARTTVAKLAEDIGFNPVVCGNLFQARLLEATGGMYRVLLRDNNSPWASLSFKELPNLQQLKFGERTPSDLHSKHSYSNEG